MSRSLTVLGLDFVSFPTASAGTAMLEIRTIPKVATMATSANIVFWGFISPC